MEDRKEYIDELESISLTIAKIPKTNQTFDVPKDYFVQLEDELMAQYNLSRIPNTAEGVPDGFFAQQEAQIINRLKHNDDSNIVHLPFYRKYRWAIAVCTILMLGVIAWQWTVANPISQNNIAMSDAEAIEYLEAHGTEIPIETLIEAGAIDSVLVEDLSISLDQESYDLESDENFLESQFEF